MTAEQPETPLPPEGFATWLDYVLRPAQSPFLQVSTIAAAELAALRQKLSDTEGWLATARENLATLDAQRAEAVRERDEAQQQLAKATTRQCYIDRVQAEKERDEARTQQALSDRVLSKERDELRSEVDALRVERVFNAQALAALTNELIAARMSLDEARAKLARLEAAEAVCFTLSTYGDSTVARRQLDAWSEAKAAHEAQESSNGS